MSMRQLLESDSRKSGFHAAKPCVHVLVMCLEPVAKRGAQHARRSTWRAAFHHKMFAVKKIGGVAGIKRKSLESGKWREHARGPFPTIAHHVLDAESAAAGRKGVYRCRIPMAEIEVA